MQESNSCAVTAWPHPIIKGNRLCMVRDNLSPFFHIITLLFVFVNSRRNVHQIRPFFFIPSQSTKIPNGRCEMILIVPTIHILHQMAKCRISITVGRDSLFPISITVLSASIFVMFGQPHQYAHRQKIEPSLTFSEITNCTAFKKCAISAVLLSANPLIASDLT